jgi:hypothetical protein
VDTEVVRERADTAVRSYSEEAQIFSSFLHEFMDQTKAMVASSLYRWGLVNSLEARQKLPFYHVISSKGHCALEPTTCVILVHEDPVP